MAQSLLHLDQLPFSLIPFCFFNVLILDFPQRIFSLGAYVDSLS